MKKYILLLFLFVGTLQAKPYIVFDWGGVLGESNMIAYHTIKNTFNLSQKEAYRALKQYCSAISSNKEQGFWQHWTATHRKALPINFDQTITQAIDRTIVPYERMKQLVRTLKGMGYETPLLSNINQWRARLIRKSSGYRDHDPVLLSYKLRVEKPNPKIFSILLKRLHTTPDNVIFIDDLYPNILVARKMGIDGIQCLSYEHVVNELKKREILPANFQP